MGMTNLTQVRDGVTWSYQIFVSLLLISLLTGCGQSNSTPTDEPVPVQPGQVTPSHWVPLDVSDVAFLWPRMRGQNFRHLLPIVGSNSIIPNPNLVDTLIDFSLGRSNLGPTGFRLRNSLTGQDDLVSTPSDSWQRFRSQDIRVVSARVEDCGAGLRRPGHMSQLDSWVLSGSQPRFHRDIFEACEISMRLVAQPISGDNAVHLIYTYSDPKVLAEMMADLQALKAMSPVNTSGLPLGVHPGIAQEGGRGPFSESVKDFILKYSEPGQLGVIAFLSTNESAGGGQWNFFEAKPVTNSSGQTRWQANNLHALQGSPISQGFTVNQSDNVRSGPPNIANLGNGPLPIEAIEANFDPRRSFSTGTDCKSCHFATQLSARLARTNSNQFDRMFRSANSVMDTPGVTSFPDSRFVPFEQNNFRAFGWFENPTVSGWMAKKAGAVAASLNQMFFNSPMGPGPVCTGRQHQVMRCVLQNAGRNSRCIETICSQ
jgi:hypothetical protein